VSHKLVSLIKVGVVGVAALVVCGQALAETRPEVLERIKPVGQVTVTGAAAAPAPAAPAAAKAAPAAEAAPATPAPAVAAPAAAPAAGGSDGAALYTAKGCMACHGPDGEKIVMPTYPRIAGQGKAYLIAQMKDIKSGARDNGQTMIMKGIIATVSDAEIEAIADWLSKQ